MTIRISRLACCTVLAFIWATPATASAANDKADCAAALKGAQADKAAGKLTKALTELATCSRPVCSKPTQKQCTDLTAVVTAAQPSVVFSAKDASGNAVTAVTVTIDGDVATSTLDGTPVPVDPGSHTMRFESDGATPVEKQIVVDPATKGQTVAIALDVNPPKATPIVAVVDKPELTPGEPGTMFDTTEDPQKRYYFVGLRYRGDVVPKFMLNIFINGGKTFYSNSIGGEIDLRHDNFSLIPAITYTEYGTNGNVPFAQKSYNPDDAASWSVVDSSLKALYFSADLLWSTRIANHWDFEYGAGFGLGVIFGTLYDNWVTTPTGTNTTFDPNNYKVCQTISSGYGCTPNVHGNATVNKVGGYTEPSWANGGSKPSIFPMINFPQLGLRYKPMKQLESRIGVGFSLTGFWFGLSADYGFEKSTK